MAVSVGDRIATASGRSGRVLLVEYVGPWLRHVAAIRFDDAPGRVTMILVGSLRPA